MRSVLHELEKDWEMHHEYKKNVKTENHPRFESLPIRTTQKIVNRFPKLLDVLIQKLTVN